VRMTEPYDLKLDAQLSARLAPSRIFDPASFPSGGAGMAGTAHDYLRFLEALRAGGEPILRPATVTAMTEDQLAKGKVPGLGGGISFGYGVGVIVDPAAAKLPVGRGTWMWNGIYGTDFWVDPTARLSGVVMTNTAGAPLSFQLQEAVYRELPPAPGAP